MGGPSISGRGPVFPSADMAGTLDGGLQANEVKGAAECKLADARKPADVSAGLPKIEDQPYFLGLPDWVCWLPLFCWPPLGCDDWPGLPGIGLG